MIYTALLRGINVGGNNKVEMKKLKSTFESLNFKNVSTYINSGNVFFTTEIKNEKKITSMIEEAIEKDFGFKVNIVIRDINNIRKVVNTIPSTWLNDANMKCDVMFLWKEFNKKEIINDLTLKEDIDDIFYVDGAIVWRVDRKNINKSGLLKIVGTKLYKGMTIRNVNTARKLLAIMEQINNS